MSMTHTIEEPLVEGRLIRNKTEVVKVWAPVPAKDKFIVEPPDCGEWDSYFLEATGASGTIFRSTFDEVYPSPVEVIVNGIACLSVDDASIERQATPDAPVPGGARARVRNRLGETVPESFVLLLGGSGTPFSEVGSAVGTSENASIPFDVSSLPEGSYQLRTQAILGDGSEIAGRYALDFFLDQSPPELSVVSPLEGDPLCIASFDGRDVVNFDVFVRDQELRALGVELLLPDGTWESVGVIGGPRFPVFGDLARTLPVIVPDDLSGETTFRVTVQNARIANEDPERGSSNFENNGGLLTEIIRTAIVLPSLGLGPLATVPSGPALFSPNTDGIADDIRVLGDALDASALEVRVFTTGPSPVLVRTVVSELPIAVGDFEIVWDGRDNGGSFVSDGEYDIEVEAVNGCGAISTGTVRVEVDNTPPTVSIDNLVGAQQVAIAVEIEGTANDGHFDRYFLEFGEGAAPLTFAEAGTLFVSPADRPEQRSEIGSYETPVTGGVLVSALALVDGDYIVQLRAEDRAGNITSTTTPFIVDTTPAAASERPSSPRRMGPTSRSVGPRARRRTLSGITSSATGHASRRRPSLRRPISTRGSTKASIATPSLRSTEVASKASRPSRPARSSIGRLRSRFYARRMTASASASKST